MLMLTLWPLTAGALIGSKAIEKWGGKPRTVHVRGLSLTMGAKGED
ncbi:hypothetical protein AB0A98_22390 [Streptomyces chrestomyceticus]